MRIAIFGLSISSSWGNGHATTYRALVRELCARGEAVTFFERDVEWYAQNRDLPAPPYGRTVLYASLPELQDRFASEVRQADLVMIGSYVPEGAELGRWVTRVARGVTAFYDIDTPVTLARLAAGDVDYLSRALVPRFDLYLSFTGGPTLGRIERQFGARTARPLYCSVDPELYYPEARPRNLDLGYMGTYSEDRQRGLDRLLLEPARRMPAHRFAVAGPQYPNAIEWPGNVRRIEHLAPQRHRAFYNDQRFTLNVTRAAMVDAGYSPSVRLFEAAACATPIISDPWNGLESFFRIGEELLVSRCANDTRRYLAELSASEREALGQRARRRVLCAHTARHRARELVGYVAEVRGHSPPAPEHEP